MSDIKRVPVPLFSTFGKSSNDFFAKSFPTTYKVELATSAENGVNFVSSAEKKQNKDGSGYISGSQQVKYKRERYGVEGSATITTDNQLKGEVTLNKLGGLYGLKALIKPQVGKSNEIPVSLEFQNETASCTSSLLWKADGDLQAAAAGVVSRNGFSVGFSTEYYLRRAGEKPIGWEAMTGLVNYQAARHDVTVFAKNEFHAEVQRKESSSPAPKVIGQRLTLGSRVQYKAGADLTVHSSADFDTTKDLAEGVNCQFGGTYNLDSSTVAHAKYDTAGKLGLSLVKKVNPTVKLTLTTELDTFALAQSNNHKFAVGLNISA